MSQTVIESMELLEFTPDTGCEHPRHFDESTSVHDSDPTAFAYIERLCPSCGSTWAGDVCKKYAQLLIGNKIVLACLFCKEWVITAETLTKVVYL